MSHTWMEIQNQPLSWKQTLHEVKQRWDTLSPFFALQPHTHFLFIGCGTSSYLAQSAARLTQQMTGRVATAVPASEVFLADASVVPTGVPVIAIAISRSGTSSEVLIAVDHLRKLHPEIKIIAVTCHSTEALAQKADVTVALDFAAEQSVVMTQSFTNMLLAIQWMAAKSADRQDILDELAQLPDLLAEWIPNAEEFAQKLGRNEQLQQFVFLGLGNYYGLAAEGTLKLKEMTQTPCEYYNPLEFRHGPISIVTNHTAVVTLTGNQEFDHIDRLVTDIAQYGATTAVLQASGAHLSSDFCLALPGDLSDWSRATLYLPALQLLAYERAVYLGLNPDKPRNLNQVVIL